MDATELPLADDVEALKAHIARLGAELAARDEAIAALQEQVRLLLVRRFGASSERVADGQLGLFNEAEELAEGSDEETSEDEQSTEVAGHRRRRRGKRAPLPAHLPRIDVVHELAEHERVCPHDGAALEAFGEEVSEQLDVEPMRFRVLRHRRVKVSAPRTTWSEDSYILRELRSTCQGRSASMASTVCALGSSVKRWRR